MLPCQLNIAIDGPAGAGKSSVALRVAKRLKLVYLDTGAMYRALTWKAIQSGVALTDASGLGQLAKSTRFQWRVHNTTLELYMDKQPIPEAIRSSWITEHVSLVASYEEVRAELLQQQRSLAAGSGVVMDGRDIGTNVMPDASLKIFLTASLEERALRRLQEQQLSLDQLPRLMQSLAGRDNKDASRQHSPLAVATDAIIIDTSKLSLAEVVDLVVQHAKRVCQNGEG